MDFYSSLAAIIGTISSPGSSLPSSLIAAQLSAAPSHRKPELARVLAELLRASSNADLVGREVLHGYIRELLSTTSLTEASQDLKLAVELADEGLLLEILEETETNLAKLLVGATRVNSSSDEAFAVDFEVLEFVRAIEMEEHEELDLKALTDAVIRWLRFWHFLFIVEGRRRTESPYERLFQRLGEVMPVALLTTMALRHQQIADVASKTLCHFVSEFHDFFPAGSSEMLWDGIGRLVAAEVHVDMALALWLRWIAATSENVKPSQEILGSDRYWALLQKCLVTGSSERKKYSLYLLTASIALVQQPVNTRSFTFDPKKSAPIIAAWNKYTTLIEIVSLSTSPNQLRDATPDLKRLLDPTSHIPASWIAVLVTLGFQAGSGGVARAFWDIVSSLEKGRLARLFGDIEGRKLLQDVLLPYAANASNFVIGRSTPEKCAHGSHLAKWLGAVLNAGDAEAKKATALAVLEWVDEKEDNLFAPARAWILQGVLKGVEGEKVFAETRDLELLVKIAKMRRFTRMKSDVCVAIVLRILLAVDVKKVGFDAFWSSLAEMALGKEYLLSEDYFLALNPQCEEFVVSPEQLGALQDMAFGEEGSPSKVELLKSAMVLYSLARPEHPQLEGLAEWLECFKARLETGTPRLSFWTVIQANAILFSDVSELLNRETLFPNLVKSYLDPSEHDADLARFLESWSISKPEEARSNSLLTAIFAARWAILREMQGQKFELDIERQRVHLAAICAGSARYLSDDSPDIPAVEDVVGLIGAFELPVLGRNKHNNKEMTFTAVNYIRAVLRLLVRSISASKELDASTISRILGSLPRLMRFLENESLLAALEVIRSISSRYPQQLLECQKSRDVELDSLISNLWETVDAATLRSDYTKAYHGFIKTIFHPVILSYATENEDLRASLLRIATAIMKLGAGKRSIRPAIAKAIWTAFLQSPEGPNMICRSTWLIDIMIELIEYQQTESDKDFTVEHPLTVLFDEVAPGIDHYREYYGDSEIFSQVYVFDILSRLDEKDPVQVEFVKNLREKLFYPWTENYPGISIWTAWKKHMQLQALVLLERFVEADEAEEFLDRVINKALCWEPHPRFRFLFEWIISLCILRYPEHRNCIWKHLQNPEDQNPKLQVSLLRVGLMVARALPESLREEYFTELVHTSLPLTSNSKVVVRHQAIAMTLEFWEHAERFSYTTLTSNPLFQRIYEASTNSSYYKEFKNAKDFRTFDGVRNFTMAGIFSGNYLRGGDEVEIIPDDAFAGLEDFADGRRRRIPLGAAVDVVEAAATEPIVAGLHSGRVNYHPQDAARLAVLSNPPASAPLQTKGSDISTAPVEDDGADIILCASLLDNGFNLGGVSRVSEIMGIKTLTLASKAIVKTPEFTSVSVHSEAWLDIQEVPVADIAAYLRAKRSEGYTAVGVEQTDRSVILGRRSEWKFPKKTVLLLGTEKFGIPAELLGELDRCVEIPQKGRTRSMNVQTAAAVVLYEACRQAEM